MFDVGARLAAAAWAWLTHHAPNSGVSTAAIVAAISTLAALLMLFARQVIKRSPRNAKRVKKTGSTGTLGFWVAAIASMTVSIDTSWKFFGDRLHIHNQFERGVMFGVVELMLVSCGLAMRANVRRKDADGNPGKPGKARILAFALCAIAGYMAIDLSGLIEGVARVILGPVIGMVAVHMALGLEAMSVHSGEVASWLRKYTERIERWAVRVGWMAAENTSLEEEDASRRVAKLATLAYRMHNAPTDKDHKAAVENWYRQIRKSSYARLMEDPASLRRIQLRLAGMYQSIEDTSPKAVEGLQPWKQATAAPQASEDAAIARARQTLGTPAPKPAAPKQVEAPKPPATSKPSGAEAAPTHRADDTTRSADSVPHSSTPHRPPAQHSPRQS